MITKTIEGYYVRDCGNATFSPTPFEDKGYFDECNWWNNEWYTEDSSKEQCLDQLDELLILARDVDDNVPHRIKITVELEPVEYVSNRDEMKKKHVEHLVKQLSEAAGVDKEEILKSVKKMGGSV